VRRAYPDLSQAVKLDPTNPQFWLTRGNIAADAGQHETAIKNYSKVIELRPNQPMTYQNRAISLMELKAYKQAYQDINDAIRIDPDQPNFYYYRALVLLKGKKPQLALEQLNIAIDMVPAGEFIIQRAMAYAMLGDAAKALREADIAREKSGIRVLWECCEVYEQLGRDEDLLKLLDVARSFGDRLEEMQPGRKEAIEQKVSETRRRLGRM
jgi:tetratricopeptide (TPR) repeat protein